MLAEFSVCPMETEHLSKDVAKVIEILRGTGVTYRLGPMGTCVEGDADQVFAAIKRCHQAIASVHPRVMTTIMIDDSKKQAHHLGEMVTRVEQQLSQAVRG